MDLAQNPFAPGAGTQPPELSGRDVVLAGVQITLQRIKERRSDRSRLLIGLRGVGKTVLLNRIAEATKEWGYHSVMLEAPEDKPLAELLVPALRRVLLQLDLVAGSKDKLRSALGALRAFASHLPGWPTVAIFPPMSRTCWCFSLKRLPKSTQRSPC